MRNSSVDQAILEVLSRNKEHLTPHQIYEGIRLRLPAVNPSTVYRSLERLAAGGKVSVSDMGTGSAVYELVADGQHHHLVCQRCGQIATIGEEEVGRFFTDVEGKYGFKVATNHLILFGLCARCRGEPKTGLSH